MGGVESGLYVKGPHVAPTAHMALVEVRLDDVGLRSGGSVVPG